MEERSSSQITTWRSDTSPVSSRSGTSASLRSDGNQSLLPEVSSTPGSSDEVVTYQYLIVPVLAVGQYHPITAARITDVTDNIQKNNNASEDKPCDGNNLIHFDWGNIQYTTSNVVISVNKDTIIAKRPRLNQTEYPFPVKSVIHRRQSIQDVLKDSSEAVVHKAPGPVEMQDHKTDELKPADPNELKPADPNELKPADPNELKPADPNGLKHADPNGLKHADPNGLKPADPDGLKPADPNGLKQANPDGLKPADSSGLKPADPDGLKPADTDGLKPALPNELKPANLDGLKPANPNEMECIQKEFAKFRDQIQHLDEQIKDKLLELQTRNPEATQRQRELEIVNSIKAATTNIPPLSLKESRSMEEMEITEREGPNELEHVGTVRLESQLQYAESFDDIRMETHYPEVHLQIDPEHVVEVTNLDRCCIPRPLSALERVRLPGARSKSTSIPKPSVQLENSIERDGDRFEVSETNSATLIDTKIHANALLEDMYRGILLKPTRKKLQREMEIATLMEEFKNVQSKEDSETNDLKSNTAGTSAQFRVDTGKACVQRHDCKATDRSGVSNTIPVDSKTHDDELMSREKLLKPTTNRLKREMQIAMLMDEFLNDKSCEEGNKPKSVDIVIRANGDETGSKVNANETTTKVVDSTKKLVTKGKPRIKPELAKIPAVCNEQSSQNDDDAETDQPNLPKKRKRLILPKVHNWDNIKSKVDCGKGNLQSTIDATGTSAKSKVDIGRGHTVPKVKFEAKVLPSKRNTTAKALPSKRNTTAKVLPSKRNTGKKLVRSKIDNGRNVVRSKIDTGRNAIRLPKLDCQRNVGNYQTSSRQPKTGTRKKMIRSKIDTGLKKPASSKINTGLPKLSDRSYPMQSFRNDDVEESVYSRSGDVSPEQNDFNFVTDDEIALEKQAKERSRREQNAEPMFNSRSRPPPPPNSPATPSPKVENKNVKQYNISSVNDDGVTGDSDVNTTSHHKQKSEPRFNSRSRPPPPPNSPVTPSQRRATSDDAKMEYDRVQQGIITKDTCLSDNEKKALSEVRGKTVTIEKEKESTSNKLLKDEKINGVQQCRISKDTNLSGSKKKTCSDVRGKTIEMEKESTTNKLLKDEKINGVQRGRISKDTNLSGSEKKTCRDVRGKTLEMEKKSTTNKLLKDEKINGVQRGRISKDTNLSGSEKKTCSDVRGKTLEMEKKSTTNKLLKDEKINGVQRGKISKDTNLSGSEKKTLSDVRGKTIGNEFTTNKLSKDEKCKAKDFIAINKTLPKKARQSTAPLKNSNVDMSPPSPHVPSLSAGTGRRQNSKPGNNRNLMQNSRASKKTAEEIKKGKAVQINKPALTEKHKDEKGQTSLPDEIDTKKCKNLIENVDQPTPQLQIPKAEMLWISMSPSPPQTPCMTSSTRKRQCLKSGNKQNVASKSQSPNELAEDIVENTIAPRNEPAINDINEPQVKDGNLDLSSEVVEDLISAQDEIDINKNIIENPQHNYALLPPKAEMLWISLSPSPPHTPSLTPGTKKSQCMKSEIYLKDESKPRASCEDGEVRELDDNIPRNELAPNDIPQTSVRDDKDLTTPSDENDINKNVKENGGQPTQPTQNPKAEMLWISMSPSPPNTTSLTTGKRKRRRIKPENNLKTVSKTHASTNETGEEKNNSTARNEPTVVDTESEDKDTTSPPEEKSSEVLWIPLSPTPPRTPPPRFRRPRGRQNSAKVTGQRA